MNRCFELAILGKGFVAPNPMVGAVLVHNDIIIGEGYHQQFGQAHAEVNCINNVALQDNFLIEHSTLYVSLEPCVHFGKTPPCVDLIIAQKIKNIVIGCSDNFKKVNGKGIEKLKAAGLNVTVGILQNQAIELNKRFFTFHQKHRPYIILKWAQSHNAKIADKNFSKAFISNAFTNRVVHKWRSEEAGIIVGTHTVLVDNPALTNRLWTGKNPIRIAVDNELKLPTTLQLFDGTATTILFNEHRHLQQPSIFYYALKTNENNILQILKALYQLNIQSLIVEGGAKFIQSFIDKGLWDEARVITNTALQIPNGIDAPKLINNDEVFTETLGTDKIVFFTNPFA